MVPLEGKGLVAYWDNQADQLVVCSSNQNPHVILVGLAEVLQLEEGKIRVIAPDVGGGFGYKSVLHEEEVCVAWLALKYKRPFRYLEDRREHLVAAANARQHHYSLTAYADKRGRLLALDADITVDGGHIPTGPLPSATNRGRLTAICQGRMTCAVTAPELMPLRPTSLVFVHIEAFRGQACALRSRS
jgi:carbon-monoxide dehydrogenase large subunit